MGAAVAGAEVGIAEVGAAVEGVEVGIAVGRRVVGAYKIIKLWPSNKTSNI